MVRTGIGYDSHRFAPGGPMLLGGVEIPCDSRLVGHSDADAVCHAITDALLGAAALGDIGELFPDTDPSNKGRDSIFMLKKAVQLVLDAGYAIGNVDVTVIAQKPKIGPHRDAILSSLARALGVSEMQVFVKGKAKEGLGWSGRGEGRAVMAVAILMKQRPAAAQEA